MTAGEMGQLVGWGADICMLTGLVGLAYLAADLIVIARLRPRPCQPRPERPVTLLVPLCGAERGLYGRLEALLRQEYAAPVQLVCGACRSDDPAVPLVLALARDFPERRIDLVIDEREYGPNRKISNLENMLEWAEHDTLVMLDSDIVVGPGYLADVVGELQRPGVGAVTCLYYGVSGEGAWSSLSAMGINVHFLTDVIAALRFGMAEPCFGATIAMSRTLLDRLGGLSSFAGCLFDDYAIGAAVRSAGLEVAISSRAVGHVCLERSPKDLLDSQLRRARTIRAINPVGNAGAVVTHASSLALLATLLGHPDGALLLAATYAVRLAQCFYVERVFGLPRQRRLVLPISDLVSFGAYLLALFSSSVTWRGARYQVSERGELSPASRSIHADEDAVSSGAAV